MIRVLQETGNGILTSLLTFVHVNGHIMLTSPETTISPFDIGVACKSHLQQVR